MYNFETLGKSIYTALNQNLDAGTVYDPMMHFFHEDWMKFMIWFVIFLA